MPADGESAEGQARDERRPVGYDPGRFGMTKRELLSLIDRAYNKQSWHGTNLRGSVRRGQIQLLKKLSDRAREASACRRVV